MTERDRAMELMADRVQHLLGAVELARDVLAILVDPDPERGLLTNLKKQGDQQGVDLSETYWAVKDTVKMLNLELGRAA